MRDEGYGGSAAVPQKDAAFLMLGILIVLNICIMVQRLCVRIFKSPDKKLRQDNESKSESEGTCRCSAPQMDLEITKHAEKTW